VANLPGGSFSVAAIALQRELYDVERRLVLVRGRDRPHVSRGVGKLDRSDGLDRGRLLGRSGSLGDGEGGDEAEGDEEAGAAHSGSPFSDTGRGAPRPWQEGAAVRRRNAPHRAAPVKFARK
jgi:hypothetical protein